MTENAPIDCEEVLQHLLAYLDGEVDDDRHLNITAHLEQCRSCFSRAQFEARLREHMRDMGRVSVPDDVARRLRTVLESLQER